MLRSKISDLLYQLTYNEVYRELKPGEVFGGIHLLDKDQWEPSFVYPLEDSKVAFIAAPDVTGIISNMKRLKEAQDRAQFLTVTMPLLVNQLSTVKESVLNMFTKVAIPHGREILTNYQPIKSAYIIATGQCRIISHKTPTQVSANLSSDYQAIQEAQARKHKVINNKGYFSTTINSMQIGLVCRNQFAGDEALLLGENPLPYSVVTQGKVTAYKIKSRDLFNLPHDILDNVKKNCFIKLKHIEERQAQIIQEVDKVAAWDKQHDQFTEKVNKMSDRFVSASEQAFRASI